jgi:monothiol glutaredoxin
MTTRDVLKEIDEEVKKNGVVLYMKGTRDMPMCGFSARAVAVLKEAGTNFLDVNVLADPEKRDAIKKYSDWPTIPQLYIKGQFIGGSDIMMEMHQKGELGPLLKG